MTKLPKVGDVLTLSVLRSIREMQKGVVENCFVFSVRKTAKSKRPVNTALAE